MNHGNESWEQITELDLGLGFLAQPIWRDWLAFMESSIPSFRLVPITGHNAMPLFPEVHKLSRSMVMPLSWSMQHLFLKQTKPLSGCAAMALSGSTNCHFLEVPQCPQGLFPEAPLLTCSHTHLENYMSLSFQLLFFIPTHPTNQTKAATPLSGSIRSLLHLTITPLLVNRIFSWKLFLLVLISFFLLFPLLCQIFIHPEVWLSGSAQWLSRKAQWHFPEAAQCHFAEALQCQLQCPVWKEAPAIPLSGVPPFDMQPERPWITFITLFSNFFFIPTHPAQLDKGSNTTFWKHQ